MGLDALRGVALALLFSVPAFAQDGGDGLAGELPAVKRRTPSPNGTAEVAGRYRIDRPQGGEVELTRSGSRLHYSGPDDSDANREVTSATAKSSADSWTFELGAAPAGQATTVGIANRMDGAGATDKAGEPKADTVTLELARKGEDRLTATRRTKDAVLGTFELVRRPEPKVTLYLYPGETLRDGVTLGHIYVVGGADESYEIAGGPPPGEGEAGPGGHYAGVTPSGTYVLDDQEHHTTLNWPMSTIPWGAKLEKRDDGIVYYSIVEGKWVAVTGPKGVMTQANARFYDKSSREERKELGTRSEWVNDTSDLYDDKGALKTTWRQNDFGEWAWNLKREGSRSAYYVHTTPDDEESFAAGKRAVLANSHGCVHVQPADRNEMMAKGYLRAGVKVIIKPYGEKGPPPAR